MVLDRPFAAERDVLGNFSVCSRADCVNKAEEGIDILIVPEILHATALEFAGFAQNFCLNYAVEDFVVLLTGLFGMLPESRGII